MFSSRALSKVQGVIIVIVVVSAAAAGGYYNYIYSKPPATGEVITVASGFGVADSSDIPSIYAMTVAIKQYGYTVKHLNFTGSQAALAALISGQADVLTTGSPPVLGAISKNQSLVAFGAGESAQDLILECAGNITSAAQMVNQKASVAVTSFGDTSYYPIAVWLNSQGINRDSVNWVTIAGSAGRLAALLSGKVQCAGVDVGGSLVLASQGSKFHILSHYAAMLPKGFPLDVLFTTRQYFNAHQGAMLALVKAWIVANRWAQNKQNFISFATPQLQNLNAAQISQSYDILMTQGVFDPNCTWNVDIATAIANVMVTYKLNGVTVFLSPSSWADFNLYQQAISQLGPYSGS